MSWLRAHFRDRGPRRRPSSETEAMKRQSSAQEHEIIELQEHNVDESETDRDKPLNAQTRKQSKGLCRGVYRECLPFSACAPGGISLERDPWKSCRNVIFWKCKLWMVISMIFLVIFLVILISLILYSNVYTDEDDYWDPNELLSNGNFHSFSGTLELMCVLPHFSSKDITKRLTEVYSSSPALGRYFRSAQVISFSNESSTVIYQLVFSVPPSTEEFMKNSMNPDFIRNILRQNIYDEDTLNPGTPECDRLKLYPTSLT
ncbi:TPA-induced transmembrane protein isoform X1 [Vidua chalybeata]|uniref:TPA-induced transmembrane protein isoform X1 n=1 Tax=Vidua chalybeata TaxID=81927 RepID=UPI0023A8D575|nr:TPA-induced transmembrane protein isoform X1 [Vidua chalybeata]